MHIAYIISAYKSPKQLIRLVSCLAGDHATCLIHVDKKSPDDVYAQMVTGVASLPNVQFLPRHVCHWGDFGHVRATLKGIKTLVERSIAFDCAVPLTGQNYPIKSTTTIEETFRAASGASFMDYRAQPWDDWVGHGLKRIEKRHFDELGQDLAHYPGPQAAQTR
jgi:hypothetical protein